MLPIKDYFVQCNYKLHIGASLVAQTAKNPAVVQETGVLILGSERSLEKGMYSCLKKSMDREARRATVHKGCKESDMTK